MSDLFDPPEPEEERPEDSCPWDSDPSADSDPPSEASAKEGRQRHDAFTGERKTLFLNALAKYGCIQDACRHTGVSPRTVYRHQEAEPSFFDNCALALRMSSTPIELTAWQRAVEGVEQEFACGGQVHVRRRFDGSLLRLLLQGSNPKKYGPRPGFKRKRVLKAERKQMEREIRAEIAAKRPSFADAMELLDKQLKHMDVEGLTARYLPGWTRSPEGHMVPPGYAPIQGYVAPAAEGEEEDGAPLGPSTPRDSM